MRHWVRTVDDQPTECQRWMPARRRRMSWPVSRPSTCWSCARSGFGVRTPDGSIRLRWSVRQPRCQPCKRYEDALSLKDTSRLRKGGRSSSW